jgi:DNA-binding XRE family transcriptional regulator
MPAGAERDDLIRKLYAQGASQSDIARQVGLSRQRLFQLMDELRIPKRKRLTPEQRIKQVPVLIRAGLTGEKMAEKLGVKKAAMYRDIARAKPHLSKATRLKYLENWYAKLRAKQGQRDPRTLEQIDKRRSKILPLIEKGWTLGRIADKFQVTGQTIRNDLVAMKVGKRVEEQVQANRVAQSRRTRRSNALDR